MTCGERLWSFHRPFVVIGRDEAADLVLNHPRVSRRHAYLQVIRGRLFCVDMGSRTGIRCGGGPPMASGWVEPGEGLWIGPFELRCEAGGGPAASAGRAAFPDPLTAMLAGPAPRLEIEPAPGVSSDGPGRPASWHLRCALTLIGSAESCGIRLPDRSISRHHCALVRTTAGIWVVDLLGREGAVLNERGVRCARLQEGDDLRIGRYAARLRDDREAAAAPGGSEGSPETTTLVALARPSWPLPPGDGPSDHLPALTMHGGGAVPTEVEGPLDGVALSQLLNQVGRMQGQMLQRYHESMRMAARMLASLCWEEMGAIRDELERARGLVQELRALKEDLASLPAAGAPAANTPRALGRPGRTPAASGGPTDGHGGGAGPPTPRDAERADDTPRSYQEICLWLCQRAELMEGEQRGRWQDILKSILGARRPK